MSSLVEQGRDGHVALCRLNRPGARNALSPELMEALAGAIGLGRVVRTLDALHSTLGEERYRVSPLLRARAASDLSRRFFRRGFQLLKCQSGSTEQLLFQPMLPLGGPFTSNLGHRSNCTLLLRAVYAKGS